MMRFLALTLGVLLALAVAGCGSGKQDAVKAPDLMGLRGKHDPRAEKLFDSARVLWKDSDVCSDPEKAVSLLDETVKIAPEFGEAYVRRGLAKSEMGLYEEAFEDLTAGIRLNPSAEAYAFRALVSLRGNHFMAAVRDLEYSLKLNSSQYRSYLYLGDMAFKENQMEEACGYYSKACSNGDCSRLDEAKELEICR